MDKAKTAKALEDLARLDADLLDDPRDAVIASLRAALAEMTAERDRHRDMAAHLTRGKRG